MTSAPTDTDPAQELRDIEHLDWSTPAGTDLGSFADDGAGETFSPARGVLPWALLVLVLSAVSVAYAVVLEINSLVTGTEVLTATVVGAVTGLVVRDGRDRWVSKRRALGDGLRRLGRALWS